MTRSKSILSGVGGVDAGFLLPQLIRCGRLGGRGGTPDAGAA